MKAVFALPLVFFRLFYQSIYLALTQIWANKTRSVLTTLGIVIGVASVTAVIAALTGLKAKILTQVETFGTNTIFMGPHVPERGPMSHANWWQLRFRPEQFDNVLQHCPSVAVLSRMGGVGRRTVRCGEQSVDNVEIQGIEPAYHQIEHRPVVLGRIFSLIDNEQVRQVCLIEPKLRDKLRMDQDCIGETLRIGSTAFVVVGVIEARPQMNFGDSGRERYEVFIPFNTLKKFGEPFTWAMASGKSAETLEDAQAELKFFLRRTRNVRPGQPDTFEVQSLQNVLNTFNKIAVIVTMVAGGIVGISLLVGGVGIMNIMLVSVTERTREIGLRKAVGARRSAILTQFMIESVTLCFFGGLVGIGLGQLLTMAIANIPQVKLDLAHIPLWAIGISFGFAGIVGICFGMVPAIKAARLDPIEALRHE
ncbi:MAG: ABC transporter permease [Planctomycetes bacterium]|nr:ABC transporter permease [Planctomycetota bacterium]